LDLQSKKLEKQNGTSGVSRSCHMKEYKACGKCTCYSTHTAVDEKTSCTLPAEVHSSALLPLPLSSTACSSLSQAEMEAKYEDADDIDEGIDDDDSDSDYNSEDEKEDSKQADIEEAHEVWMTPEQSGSHRTHIEEHRRHR